MTVYNLDDEVRAFVDDCLGAFATDSAAQSPLEQRARYARLCQKFDCEIPEGISIEDRSVTSENGPVPIRLYRPVPAGENTQNPGCLIYFHGGGWVVGNLDSHHAITAEIASAARIVVIAVDYRLAPEHPYPAGHEDCWSVVHAVMDRPEDYGIDPARIAVGGDSAGAHIAAGMARRARDRANSHENDRHALVAQILVYGFFGGDRTLPSYRECSDAPLLSTADMDYYHDSYWPHGMLADDAMARPLLMETMAGLPPAFIQAAEFDPLRDDSVEYARRLEAAGVAVELHVENGLVHGYLRSRHVTRKGADAFRRVCHATARMLGA